MKLGWGLVVSAALVACGSTSKTNLTFYVDAPPDVSCIGVAGFDVAVTAGTETSRSGPLLNETPVLELSACHLTHPFSMQDVDIDSPASVVVTGHDGAGSTRVQGTADVQSLRAGAARVQLRTTATPPWPVLVVHWPTVLSGSRRSDVSRLVIMLMGGGRQTLVDVGPGDYFSVEPGAYGVPANLAPDGVDDGQAIFVDVTTTTQGLLPRTRLNAVWNAAGRYYETK